MSIELSTIPLSPNNQELNGAPGIKLKVTNENGIESYLIGTMHVVDKQSIDDPDINKIIDKCSMLYCEVGPYTFITSAQGSVPEGNHKYQHIPFRYIYDTTITLAAWCKKIPIIPLDCSIKGKTLEQHYQILQKYGPDAREATIMENCAKSKKNPFFGKFLDKWKKGNIFVTESNRKNLPDSECVKREKHWAKTLVPQLQTTSQPICIAVGAFHVVGDGLPEIFRNAGLKVEWIAPSQFNAGLNVERIIPHNSHSFSDRFARAFRIPRSRL